MGDAFNISGYIATMAGGIVALTQAIIWIRDYRLANTSILKLPIYYKRKKVNWADFNIACKLLYKTVKMHYSPEIIIGCSRGGAVVAGILSKHFGSKMAFIDFNVKNKNGQKEYTYYSTLNLDVKSKRILIVDDAPHSGKMMLAAISYVKKLSPSEIKTASIISQDNYGNLNQTKQNTVLYSTDYRIFISRRNDYKMPYE